MSFSKFITTKIVHHGPDALTKLPYEIDKLGATKPCIVTDQGLASTEVFARVQQASPDNTVSFCDVIPDPPMEVVSRCAEFIKANSCDLVIGLGGGSSIDTAKMGAAIAVHGGTVLDYLGLDKIPGPGLPLIAIPTTAGTGSEASSAAVFVDPADQAKKGLRSDFVLPRVAILDPSLTLSLPKGLTAATGVDALTHAIECYTYPAATYLSDLAAEASIQLIGKHLRRAYTRGDDIQARDGMLLASYLAGVSLANSNVGVVHAIAHILGGMYGIGHGLANAVLLPYVMEFNRISCREKYASIGRLLGEDIEGLSVNEASMLTVSAVRQLTIELEVPQKLSEINIPKDGLEAITDCCMQTQVRIIANNPRITDRSEILSLLKSAY